MADGKRHRPLLSRFFLALALLAAMFLSACGAEAHDKAVQRVTPYVVQIVVVADNLTDSGTPQVIPIGNGILVNRAGWVVTAAHLIDVGHLLAEKAGQPSATLGVVIPAPKGLGASVPGLRAVSTNQVDQFAVDLAHDLALLKCRTVTLPNPGGGGSLPLVTYSNGTGGALTIQPLSLDVRVPKAAAPLAMSGYLESQLSLSTSQGKLASVTPVSAADTNVAAVDNLLVKGSLFDCYQLSFGAGPNGAGAPMYLADSGSIVGLYVGIADEPKGVLIPSNYVARLLDSFGVEWGR